MVGRLAMNNIWEVACFDREFFPEKATDKALTREEVMRKYAEFC